MSEMRRVLLTAAALAATLTATIAAAGADPLSEWTEDPEDVIDRVWIAPPHANGDKLKGAGKMPVKAGLVSFYIFDTGDFKFNAMAATYGGTVSTTVGLKEHAANTYASELARLGVPALKKEFADAGMTLLTPVEFLQTDEQKRAYADFVLPRGGFARAALKVVDWVEKSPQVEGGADGYKMITTHLWQDAEGLTALEGLRAALGLDALVVVANTTSSSAKGVILGEVRLEMYGTNPVPKPEGRLASIGWTPGIPYVKGNFGKGFKGAQLAVLSGGEEKSASYAGYDIVAGALAKASLKDLRESQD